MKTKYKILPLTLYLFLTLISFGFLVLIYKWILLGEFSPISIFIVNTFISFMILGFLGGSIEIKSMIIDNQMIKFKYFFGLIIYKYNISEVEGFNVEKFHNKVGDHLAILIKTADNKVYVINGFLISNTEQIKQVFSNRFRFDNSIRKPKVGKKEIVLFCFLGCFLLSFIWLIISKI